MSPTRQFRHVIPIVVIGLVAAACSSGAGGGTTMAGGMAGHHAGEYGFGDPAEGSDASRVIQVSANDDFTFSPASVSITAGETVTFRVTNTGSIPHDFVLGDSHIQDEHEAEMAEMSGDMAMHDEPNAFVLDPGETKEMTWHMTERGEILFGCHQPGHFVAGMKGVVTVSG